MVDITSFSSLLCMHPAAQDICFPPPVRRVADTECEVDSSRTMKFVKRVQSQNAQSLVTAKRCRSSIFTV